LILGFYTFVDYVCKKNLAKRGFGNLEWLLWGFSLQTDRVLLTVVQSTGYYEDAPKGFKIF